ncbi:retrovirus-related pol polyprotein from transposon TNT 1-94 [Tanacetum coccineum]
MSNSNINLQTHSSNALYNAIMEAGSKDRPPIELIHYCLQNPPYTYQWAEKTVPVAEGIDNDIYSTVDACPNACEMWKAIKRLKQGESINVQDLETNLYWEFGKFTSWDGESLESYYSRFYKMKNELVRNQCHSQELKIVSYHKLYDILKQHQNEVNEIRAERLARTANPLALVAQQQPVYHHQNHPTQNTQYSSTRSQQSTRNRGKAIVTSSAPTYDPEPATVTEDDEMSKEKEIDKLMALISLSFKKIYKPTNNNLRTSSNTSRANQDNSPRINRGTGYDNQRAVNVAGARENVGTPVVQKFGIQCYNCKEYGHVSRECQKLKRVKDAAYHKEKMLLCKQEEAGVQLNAKQADWKDDTDDEANAKQKPEINFLESSKQRELVDKLKGEIEDFKTKNKSLESSNNHFKEANNELSKTNQLMFKDLKKFQAELDKYNDVNYASKGCYNDNLALMLAPDSDETIRLEKERRSKLSDLIRPFDYDQLNNLYDLFVPQREKSPEQHYFPKTSKMSHTSSNKEFSKESFRKQTTLLEKRMDESIPWDQKCKSSKELFKIKKSVDTFLPKVDTLKSQLETQETQFLNEIDRLSREYYYADHMNAILGVYTDLDEVTNLQCDYLETWEKCEHLEKELSKSRTMSKSFEALQKHAINLELDLQQLQTAMDVPINTREPKQNVNQSVATSSKKTVTTDSTVKKFRNTTKKIYEQVSKTCSWWYPKYTPPGYNWKPKSQIGMLTKRSMPLGTPSRTANSLEHKNS